MMRIQFWFKAGLTVLAVVLPCQLYAADGSDLFARKCALCHVLPDPHNLTAEMWPKQMEIMAPRAALTPEEKEKITRYLVSNAGQLDKIMEEERRLYAENCGTCHQEKPLAPTTLMGMELQDFLQEHVEEKVKENLPDEVAHEIAEYYLHTKLQ